MRLLLKILSVAFILLIHARFLGAQAIPAPQNLRASRLVAGLVQQPIPQFIWDSVAGAKDYRIDVAADSDFKQIVFGLQNFPQSRSAVFFAGRPYGEIYTQQLLLGKTGMAVFNRCFTQLFFRVRAEGNTGQLGTYSSTASISLSAQPCNNSNPSLPDAIFGFLKRQRISYYEGPLSYGSGFPSNNLLYYFARDPITPDYGRPVFIPAPDSLVQVLVRDSIPIDTAWCHDGGPINIPALFLEGDRGFTVPRRLFVKLRYPDARIKNYGFSDSLEMNTNSVIAWWNYSNSFTYYRYTFSTTTSVRTTKSYLDEIKFSPQPCSDGGQVSYTLAQASNVSAELCTLLGSTVLSVGDQWQAAGSQSLRVDTRQCAAGVYVLRLRVRDAGGRESVQARTIHVVR